MSSVASVTPRPAPAGVAALVATVLLWSSFALTSRAVGGSGLTTLDAAALRFGVPLLALGAWLPRALRRLRAERPGTVALLLVGGLPHFLVFTWGADLTSAGLTGLLVPGTVPVFVTLLLVRRRRVPPRTRVVALGVIMCGVTVSASTMTSGRGALGVAVLLTAGLGWAVYTVGLARTRLGTVDLVVLLSHASTLGVAALAATGAMPLGLARGVVHGDAPVADALGTALLLGVGTGLLSTACYAQAVRRLGSSVPAVAGAASPVVTALAAAPLLGEPVGLTLAAGLALVVVGIVAFHRAPPVPTRPTPVAAPVVTPTLRPEVFRAPSFQH